MAVDNNDRITNRHNVEVEADIASLKLIYNTLSVARRKLLEEVLRKLIICTNLLNQVLPAARMLVFMLDFDNYRETATKEIKANPDIWSTELIQLFASPSMALLLPYAYLAVKEWNAGGFYAPEYASMWGEDPAYPVQAKELKGGSLQKRIERLILRVNEPLNETCGDMTAKPPVHDADDLPPAPEDSCD